MRLRDLSVMAVLAAGACTLKEPPQPIYKVSPQEIDIDPVAWSDQGFYWESVAVINETYFPLTITNVRLNNPDITDDPLDFPPGAERLELEEVDPAIEIGVRETARLQVRIRPPREDDRTLWFTSAFSALLEFDITGTGELDPNTQEPDPASRVTVGEKVQITYAFNCDLDGDLFDADACGGDDCNDHALLIGPLAPEICDEVDNNCGGGVDEGCIMAGTDDGGGP